MLGTLILLQLAATLPPAELAGFDLSRIARPQRSCADARLRPDEILVCVRREDDPLPPIVQYEIEPLFPRAQRRLPGGALGSIDTEQVGLAPGVVSQRALVRIRWPF